MGVLCPDPGYTPQKPGFGSFDLKERKRPGLSKQEYKIPFVECQKCGIIYIFLAGTSITTAAVHHRFTAGGFNSIGAQTAGRHRAEATVELVKVHGPGDTKDLLYTRPISTLTRMFIFYNYSFTANICI